jgi:glycosyltransferase involved in cell wall biosynthesis
MLKPVSIAVNGRFLCQPITGVQRYARELIRALDSMLDQRNDIDVTVISPRLKSPAPVWRNIELQQCGKLRGHAWEQLELPYLSAGKILFCPGNTAPVLSLLSRQRTVVCVHDLSYLYFPDAYRAAFRVWYKLLMPIVFRSADALITVSESERKSLVAHYPHSMSRLVAIQNGGAGAISDGESETLREPGGYVLYVGSLSKRKNFPGMLEAACSNVLAKFYRGATCFLFPSFYEASPLPPIEAMAYGAPVIASDIPSLRERCGEAALYCDPFSVDSIEQVIERLVDNKSLQEKLRVLGLIRAAEFTWEECARQTVEVIRGG